MWCVTVQPLLASASAVTRYLAQAAEQVARGDEVPFAIVACDTGTVIGSTRWMDIWRAHHRVEIGGTWLVPMAQRTLANTEAKYLQLPQLLEVLGAVRVQFKTDLRNTQSQRALENLGVIREGVLRRHMVVRDGCRSGWRLGCERRLPVQQQPQKQQDKRPKTTTGTRR